MLFLLQNRSPYHRSICLDSLSVSIFHVFDTPINLFPLLKTRAANMSRQIGLSGR